MGGVPPSPLMGAFYVLGACLSGRVSPGYLGYLGEGVCVWWVVTGGGRGCRGAWGMVGDPGGWPGLAWARWGAVAWVGVAGESLAQNTRWHFWGLAQNLGQLAQNGWPGGQVLGEK